MSSAQTQSNLTISDSTFLLLEGNLKRVFSMNIGYTTFREIQNIVFNCTENNSELSNFFFELLVNGNITQKLNPQQEKNAQTLISEFMIPIRVAKDVHERGEFVNFITSDMIVQQERCVFLNRLARVDGQEFLLMTDVQNATHLVRHFISRLLEAQKNTSGANNLAEVKEDINLLKNYLDELIKGMN